jgi:hypothetical protein
MIPPVLSSRFKQTPENQIDLHLQDLKTTDEIYKACVCLTSLLIYILNLIFKVLTVGIQ